MDRAIMTICLPPMFSHHESAGSYTAIQDIDDSACSDEVRVCDKGMSYFNSEIFKFMC